MLQLCVSLGSISKSLSCLALVRFRDKVHLAGVKRALWDGLKYPFWSSGTWLKMSPALLKITQF